jgi:hypothetical protein
MEINQSADRGDYLDLTMLGIIHVTAVPGGLCPGKLAVHASRRSIWSPPRQIPPLAEY